MLYTVDFEYKGGTYLAQVQAAVLEDVLRLWLEQTPDTELARWSADRLAIAQSIAGRHPLQCKDWMAFGASQGRSMTALHS